MMNQLQGYERGSTSSTEVKVLTLEEALALNTVSIFQYRLLLMCGFAMMADSMEINLLTFLSICAGAEWNLNGSEQAAIGGTVFAGIVLGSFFWGEFAGRYGRRSTYLLSNALIALGGALSGAAPSLPWLIFFRAAAGFGIGGAFVPFDQLAEFLPASHRGKFLIWVFYFWVLGSLLVSGVAWATLDSEGWRFLAFMTAVPIAIVSVVSYFYLPESPRWLLVIGKVQEATQIVRDAAAVNGVIMEPFILAAHNTQHTTADTTTTTTTARSATNNDDDSVGGNELQASNVKGKHITIDTNESCSSYTGGNDSNGYRMGYNGNIGSGNRNSDSHCAYTDENESSEYQNRNGNSSSTTTTSVYNSSDSSHDNDTAISNSINHSSSGCCFCSGDVAIASSESRNEYWELVRTKEMRRITLPVCTVWMMFGFAYYGVIIFIDKLFAKADNNSSSSSSGSEGEQQQQQCSFDYAAIFYNALSEVAGVYFGALLIDCAGRVNSQAIFYALSALSALLLGFPLPFGALLFVSIVARFAAVAAANATWVQTSELYPTELRTEGHAAGSAASKVAAFIAPFFIFSDAVSDVAVGIVLAVMNIVAVVATLQLPETSMQELDVSVHAVVWRDNQHAHCDSSNSNSNHTNNNCSINNSDGNGSISASSNSINRVITAAATARSVLNPSGSNREVQMRRLSTRSSDNSSDSGDSNGEQQITQNVMHSAAACSV